METSSPFDYLAQLRPASSDDSLKKLRRDRGKMEELIARLTFALEDRGGTVEHLFGLLSQQEGSTTARVNFIAGLIMGTQRLVPIDPLEVLTKTGASDEVRRYAVTAGGIKEEDLPVDRLLDPLFVFPRTRLAIVERLTDQKKLKRIALEGDQVVGALAVRKLTSPKDLYDVAAGANYGTTCLAAIGQMTDQKLIRRFTEDRIWIDTYQKSIAEKRLEELGAAN
ncbi:MAG: hypothetical protein AAB794_03755 [Patescibacteria group bacterium]